MQKGNPFFTPLLISGTSYFLSDTYPNYKDASIIVHVLGSPAIYIIIFIYYYEL